MDGIEAEYRAWERTAPTDSMGALDVEREDIFRAGFIAARKRAVEMAKALHDDDAIGYEEFASALARLGEMG